MMTKNVMIASICFLMLAASAVAADVHAVLSLDNGDGALVQIFDGNMTEGSTAEDLLNATDLNVSVLLSETGLVVTGIDDVMNDEMNEWVFQVNGVASEVAVDQYVLQNDDMVLFTFTPIAVDVEVAGNETEEV
ncbi:MAG: DUF4430 domain-containing protein [Methanotrichaceae archaeon]|nr:DUF4430 domain-containing protein [Methanotrichaceae archaeon]